MSKMNIAVIFGSRSCEHDVSIISALQLIEAAKAAGISPAEVTLSQSESFSVRVREQKLEDYKVSDRFHLVLRGAWQGRIGTASTQAMDEESLGMLVQGVKESAELIETDEQDEILPPEERYDSVCNYSEAVERISEIDDAEVVELNEEHLILYAGSEYRREMISKHYSLYIQEALKEIFRSDAKLIVFGEKELESYREVEAFLDRITDGTYRTILRRRYLDVGLSWSEIRDRLEEDGLYYSERHIVRLHTQAVEAAQTLWNREREEGEIKKRR